MECRTNSGGRKIQLFRIFMTNIIKDTELVGNQIAKSQMRKGWR